MSSPTEYRSLTQPQRSRYVGLAMQMLARAATDKAYPRRRMRLEGGRGSGWSAMMKTHTPAEQQIMAWMYGIPVPE